MAFLRNGNNKINASKGDYPFCPRFFFEKAFSFSSSYFER